MILMLAMLIQAEALLMECSQSFANRRHRPNQPNVRSTTHRLDSLFKCDTDLISEGLQGRLETEAFSRG
jgi:hypothetical protein